jgi:hypothetical protein
MDTVATKLHETGLQLARQRNAFVSRTREAGQAFVNEAYDAGRQLVGAVQTEARRWRRFAVQRTAQLRGEARTAFSLPAVERSVLSQVDQTLRAASARVRTRLAELEKPGKATRRSARRKAAPRARRSRQNLPAIAA